MLTLALVLALHAVAGDLPPRQMGSTRPVDRSTKDCPKFRLGTERVQVERCVVLDSGDLAVLDGDRYVYTRYCVEVKELRIPCAAGRGSHAVAVSVRRAGETALRLVTTGFALGGQSRRPSIVANRYGHILELPTILAATCDCNVSRYFLKQPGSRQWRELNFNDWKGELSSHLPVGLKNTDTPWPDLSTMTINGVLWQQPDAHCCPTGGWFSGEFAIEGDRFVLKSIKVTRGDGNELPPPPIPLRQAPQP